MRFAQQVGSECRFTFLHHPRVGIGQEKTLEEYYKKMKAATNSVTAFQFYQAEVYLLTQLRANTMSQIPTYGQLVQAAKKSQ